MGGAGEGGGMPSDLTGLRMGRPEQANDKEGAVDDKKAYGRPL